MVTKILLGGVICFCTYLMGNELANVIKEKILMVSDYVLFLQALKSSVTYSGENLFSFFEKCAGREKEFVGCLIKNKSLGIKAGIEKYPCKNKVESECVNIVKEALLFAEESSDALGIADMLEESITRLNRYKQQLEEELYGKIKTTPRLFLMAGMFVFVLLI